MYGRTVIVQLRWVLDYVIEEWVYSEKKQKE